MKHLFRYNGNHSNAMVIYAFDLGVSAADAVFIGCFIKNEIQFPGKIDRYILFLYKKITTIQWTKSALFFFLFLRKKKGPDFCSVFSSISCKKNSSLHLKLELLKASDSIDFLKSI